MVTTTRALFPASSFFQDEPDPLRPIAKPGRNACSRNAFSSAGIVPSHRG